IWLANDKKRPQARLPATDEGPGREGGTILGTFTHLGSLKVGDSYTNTVTVTVPTTVPSITVPHQDDPLSGQWYITPWTNAYDQVLQVTLDVNINPDDPQELA